ncbi:MAG: hypothetical protein Q8M92_05380 [Candidatus Subteraquimicrobiales bacterium]|nr:hypothetical protein [Candidatus Subteraquimicrobiales bacterium]
MEKPEVLIDWSNSAEKIKNLVRALNPHPGAHTIIQGKRVKIWRAKVINLKVSCQEAGSVLLCDGKEGLAVACGSGHLLLEEMQPEGKGKMTGAEFCRGHKIQFGEKLKVP